MKELPHFQRDEKTNMELWKELRQLQDFVHSNLRKETATREDLKTMHQEINAQLRSMAEMLSRHTTKD